MRFGTLANSRLKDVDLPGLGGEKDAKKEIAQTIALIADANWSDPQIREQFQNDPTKYIDWLIQQELPKWESSGFLGLGGPKRNPDVQVVPETTQQQTTPQRGGPAAIRSQGFTIRQKE